jgi:hypothetical protein
MEDPLLNPIEPSSRNGGSTGDLGPFPLPPPGLETDPFYAFRDELAQTTRKALARVERLKTMKTADEILGEAASIRKILTSLKENVSHLERLVAHVERKRADFDHLSDEEISWRRGFLRSVQGRFRQMESELVAADANAARIVDEERRQLKVASAPKPKTVQPSTISPIRKVADEEAGPYDSAHLRYNQEQMLKEQDSSLDEISGSLGRLRGIGDDMYREIESQNNLLDEVNEEAHGLTGKMDGALGRLDKFLHSNSRGQTVSIMFLVGVLVVEIIILSLM